MDTSKNKMVKAITGRDEDFAQWYTDVCKKAELMDYTTTKGFIIYRPYGYKLWEGIRQYLDDELKATGHENVYFPMVIPESLFQKEKEHVEGFAPETAVITKGGDEELTDPLIVRPTSEVLFCDHYAKIVSSYRDLPKKYNQWCSVVRWEKTTRPFLRGSEFLWQEGHTIHETKEEAEKETLDILKIYEKLGRELLAIPFITGRKTDKEKFAGAEATYTLEALMHDNKALQSGTTHYFGQGFAKAFQIQFQDREKNLQYVYQTSWGVTTRLIGAIIMVHGDDSGLVLPPRLAPIQVMIVPIQQTKEGIMDKCRELRERLVAMHVRAELDSQEKSPGWKFAESEMRGIPLRMEVGPRDLTNGTCVLVRRLDNEKIVMTWDDAIKNIPVLLEDIQKEMLTRAEANVRNNTRDAHTYEEFKDIIANKGGYVRMMWCGDRACEDKIKEDTQATARCIPFDQEKITDICPVCGRKATKIVYFAKAY